MAETKLEHNAGCKDVDHKSHLCYLMYEGFHFDHPAEYKAIVQDAQFRCQNCGRTAHKRDQVCHPVPL
ncbi:MAG: hypothetical protein ACYTFX_05780 [Planctomycetota bacterium]